MGLSNCLFGIRVLSFETPFVNDSLHAYFDGTKVFKCDRSKRIYQETYEARDNPLS